MTTGNFANAPFLCPVCHQGLRFGPDMISCSAGHTFACAAGRIPVLLSEGDFSEVYDRQVQYFTDESSHYASDYHLDPWMKKYVDLALGHFGPPAPGATVLDVGCGSGYMTIELARAGYNVIAADLTPQSVLELSRKAEALGVGTRVCPVICSALDLPIADNCIDAVVGNAIIEHLPDDHRFVSELARVAKHSAKGLLVAPVKLKHVWPMFWPINYWHDRKIGHLRRYDKASYLSLLAANGFTADQVSYSGHLVKVAGVLLQTLFHTHRWDERLEELDAAKAHRAYGSSNVIVTFHKA
ncbi:class I SAM-dependent methyltransferase [bacterium]|nr:class I SAM-dependent methyltransferase [bacterium]